MDIAEQILVVILSGALAVFLMLAIVAAVCVIRLVQSLRRIAESAEHIVHSAESVGDIFAKGAGPLGAFRLIRSIIEAISHHKDDKGK